MPSRFVLGLVLLCSAASPAAAGGMREQVHADSFGNLIVISPSGVKRIIVGQGDLAPELQDYTGGSDELYADGERASAGEDGSYDSRYSRPCPAIFVKGRSYMYGFDEGVIPLFGDRCL